MFSRVSTSVSRFLALACVISIPLALGAQNSAKPAAKPSAGDSASRWDIFAGYSFFEPNAHVDGTSPTGAKTPVDFKAERIGSVESVTRYFNDHWGLQMDSGQHDRYVTCEGCYSNSAILTVQGGLVYRWTQTRSRITPWAHALGGAGQLEGPDHQNYTPGYTFTVGGGLDREIAPHWAIRGEGDYEFMHVDFGAPHYADVVHWQPGGIANLEGIRVAGGVVYHIGTIAPPPAVTLACSASPASVYPGESVTVTAMAGDLLPKMSVIYSLSGAGVNSNTPTATVATGTLAPGAYTVNCGVKEGRPGKEGLKPWESATASASFTVKQFEPPTISCSVSPTTIKPGDSATVTAVAVSPQNRPLTYTYTTSVGTIEGNGPTAIFSSVGAPTGPVTITCTATDDKNQSATATINTSNTVTITAPYVPPTPHTQALCSISFVGNNERPSRVNNEAKACLDEVALDLQKQSDAQAVVVGTSDEKEKASTAREAAAARRNSHLKVVDLAAERAVNAKEYLVTEKGVDSSRISVATSTTDGQTVEDYLVPAGANFSVDVPGTTPVSAEVKAKPRKPLHAAPRKRVHAGAAHRKAGAAKKKAVHRAK